MRRSAEDPPLYSAVVRHRRRAVGVTAIDSPSRAAPGGRVPYQHAARRARNTHERSFDTP